MSIKTLRKRIALVAVSALGVGLLSVAPASAAAGDSSFVSATGLVGSTVPSLTSSAGSATLQVGGSFTITVAADTNDKPVAKVTGGKFTSVSGGTISPAGTTATSNADNTALTALTATPTAAGTDMVIYTYADAAATASTDINDTWTITVVAAGASETYSASNSYISLNDYSSATSTVSDTLGANAVLSTGSGARINYDLKDGLNNDMPSTTDVNFIVASGDCSVGDTASGATTPFDTDSDSVGGEVYVVDNDSDDATTCVVDVQVNGVKQASKTIYFYGPVASITVSDLSRGSSATTSAQTGLGYVVAKDAAGNTLGNITLTAVTTDYTAIVTAVSVANSGATASLSTSVNSGAAAGSTPTSIGWTCSGVKGQSNVRLKYTSASGVVTYSNTFAATCYGNPATYTASLDKASYLPGEIATLTITAKDSGGNLVNDAATLGTNVTYEVGISGAYMTAVTTPTNSATFTNGVKTYKFTVGATPGKYNMIVDLPKWNTTTYNQSAVTVAYSITSGTTTVTNEEVLAAIVKLIASINKQIRALQKSLRR